MIQVKKAALSHGAASGGMILCVSLSSLSNVCLWFLFCGEVVAIYRGSQSVEAGPSMAAPEVVSTTESPRLPYLMSVIAA